jgi:hypothetical protein
LFAGPPPRLDNLPQNITIEESHTGNVFQVQASHEHNFLPLTNFNWHVNGADTSRHAVILTLGMTDPTGTFDFNPATGM